MQEMKTVRKRIRNNHRGRIKQIPIYLGKFFRMFIFLNDWKVLPMSALMAGIVAFVAGSNMFKTMEGTMMGAMALTCVSLWNGCFNSVQVVCRERGIIKREHRSGMHITSYIAAHMIYQGFLCLMQAIITYVICWLSKIAFPAEGIVTPWFCVDMVITLFLITYAADMLSLMISCLVKNTTAAMTAMPLVLVFQLVFSGIMFTLSGGAEKVAPFTIAKWGLTTICALGSYNSQPMVSVWNQLFRFRNFEMEGVQPFAQIVKIVQQEGMVDDFCLETGAQSQVEAYATTAGNVAFCWMHMIAFALIFAIAAVLFLKRIDHDKR